MKKKLGTDDISGWTVEKLKAQARLCLPGKIIDSQLKKALRDLDRLGTTIDGKKEGMAVLECHKIISLLMKHRVTLMYMEAQSMAQAEVLLILSKGLLKMFGKSKQHGKK